MSSRYTADGRRKSSITHSRRGHKCPLCGRVVFGNGGQVAHGRSHVRKGELVEVVKHYPHMASPSRFFVAPGEAERWEGYGFEVVS